MKNLLTVYLLFASIAGSHGQGPHKVLLDITSADTSLHSAVVRHASGLAKAYPDMEIEVVIYGPAIAMVRKTNAAIGKKIAALTADPRVTFKVCSATMKRLNITQNDLVSGVQTVPDAIMEIVTKQRDGWGYIKEN